MFGVAIFSLIAFSCQIKVYPHIPLKGLFKVLKKDDIGFAHALLHSGWIENMYQYGPGKPHREVMVKNRKKWKIGDKGDAVANLVRKFWFRKSENHQLLPTQYGYLSNIPSSQLGKLFGQIINCVYTLCQAQGERRKKIEAALIDAVITCGFQAEQYRGDLTASWWDIIDQGYKLKHDEKFAAIRKSEKELGKKVNELKEEYNIAQLEEEISQASKEWGKRKGFSQKKKEIESKFDRKGCVQVLKDAESKIFEDIDQEILDEYRKIQVAVERAEKTIAKKVKQKREPIRKNVCAPIKEALEFCKTKGIYAKRTTEAILWALFFHKLDGLISLEEKVKAINDCIDQIDDEFKNKEFCNGKSLAKFYNREDFDGFEKDIKDLEVDQQVEKVHESYDQSLHYFIHCSEGKFPPVIAQGSYGYQYEKDNEIYKISYSVPNCYETAILDLLSILWYNPAKNTFDDSVFPDRVIKNGVGLNKLRETLKYFYLADKKKIKAQEYTCEYKNRKFTSLAKLKNLGKISIQELETLDITEIPVSFINRSEIKQEFFNIISGMPEVMYCSEVKGRGKIFELETDVRNVVKIIKYFYGIEIEDIVELGDIQKGISTENREIAVKKKNENFTNNRITIGISDCVNYMYCTMTATINAGHAFLTVPARAKSGFRVLKGDFTKKLMMLGNDNKGFCLKTEKREKFRSFSIFTLLGSASFLRRIKQELDLPMLHLVYYALAMKKPEIKIAVIEDILKKRPEYYDSIKNMIYNLIHGLPSDDQYLKKCLAEIIIESGFDKKDTFLRESLKAVVKNPVFHDAERGGGSGNILKLALENNDQEIISSIVDNSGFNASGRGYGQALVIAFALRQAQGRRGAEIAKKILESPKFTCWTDAIQYALSKKDKELALEIVQHPKCKGNEPRMIDTLYQALEKGYCEIALHVAKLPEFTPFSVNLRHCLSLALKKAERTQEQIYLQVILALVKNPNFYVLEYYEMTFLRWVIRGGYKEIALAIINHSTFDVNRYKDEVETILSYTNQLWQENLKRRGELQEIIDAIEHKMEVKNNKN